MAKKLFVPERVAANMKSDTPQTKIPTAIEKALPEQEENKNTENPENMDISALERLPNPVGYRLLVIPYYPPAKTKGGIYVPDATRDREAFATVAAYVVKVGPDAYKDQDLSLIHI